MRNRLAELLRTRRSLLVVCTVAVVLMSWGIWIREPYVMGPDEKGAITRSLWMGVQRTPFLPDFMRAGNFHLYVLVVAFAPLYVVLLLTGRIDDVAAGATSAGSFFSAPEALQQAFYDFLLAGRIASVLVGLVAVLGVYALAKRTYDSETGVLSAAFLAVSLGFVNTAHFATEDVLMAATLVLTFLVLAVYLDTGDRRHLLAAALVAGLAISSKATAGLVVLPVYYLALTDGGSLRGRLLTGVQVSIAIGAAYLLTTPSILVYPSLYVQEVGLGLLGAGEATSPPPYPGIVLQTTHLLRSLGVVLFLFSILSVAFVVRGHRAGDGVRMETLLGLFAVPYFLVISLWIRSWEIWYVVPLLPVLAVVNGRFGRHLLTSVHGSSRRRLAGRTAVVVVLLVSLAYSGIAVSQLGTDARVEATEWAATSLEDSASVDVYSYPLHLPRFPSEVQVNSYWFNDSTDSNWPAARSRVECRTPEHIVLTGNQYGAFVNDPERYPEIASFYRRLLEGRAGYERVATFGPPLVDATVSAQVELSVVPRAISNDPRIVVLQRRGEPEEQCPPSGA